MPDSSSYSPTCHNCCLHAPFDDELVAAAGALTGYLEEMDALNVQSSIRRE